MIATGTRGDGLPPTILALGLGFCLLSASIAVGGDRFAAPVEAAMGPPAHKVGPGHGTLGYGPPGRHPGFQGFGLGYHPGYGYGGRALGVGAEGGYPYYGGPGYPHPWPRLRRIGGINPFRHSAGPGGPSPRHPNVYGTVGPLRVDPPTVTVAPIPGQAPDGIEFGPFTGVPPYPDTYFAPFTTAAASAPPPSVTDPLPPLPAP